MNVHAVASFNNRRRQLRLDRVNGSGNRRRCRTLCGEYSNFYNNNAAASAAAVCVPAIHYRLRFHKRETSAADTGVDWQTR